MMSQQQSNILLCHLPETYICFYKNKMMLPMTIYNLLFLNLGIFPMTLNVHLQHYVSFCKDLFCELKGRARNIIFHGCSYVIQPIIFLPTPFLPGLPFLNHGHSPAFLPHPPSPRLPLKALRLWVLKGN